MFDTGSGIEVLVRPYKQQQAYHEYGIYHSMRPGRSRRSKAYIQARPGDRYEVVTLIHPQFRWSHTRYLKFHYQIDDTTVSVTRILKKPKGVGDHPEPLEYVFDRFVMTNEGQQNVCGLSFASSELGKQQNRICVTPAYHRVVDDPTFLSVEEEEMQLNMRGKIRVTIQRGRVSTYTPKTAATEGRTELTESVVPEAKTNKAVYMDNGRSHFTL